MSLDTRGYDPQRLLPQSLEDRLLGWFGRMTGMALLTVVFVAWLSLVTWSVGDPSLTHATTEAPQNAFGRIGAIFSDLLLQTLGFAAAMALIAPLVWSIELVRSERVLSGRMKLGFFPIAVLALAGALSGLPTAESWPLNHGYGGLLGDGIFGLVERLFANINASRAGFIAVLALLSAAVALSGKAIGFDAVELLEMSTDGIKGLARLRFRAWRESRREKAAQVAASADIGAAYGKGPVHVHGHANYGHRTASPELNEPQLSGPMFHGREHHGAAPPSNPTWGHQPMAAPNYAEPQHPSAMMGNQPQWAQPAHAAAINPELPPQHRIGADGGEGFEPPVDRGAVFDRSTDMASRAIAARFAPQHVEERAPQVVAPQADAPAPKMPGVLAGYVASPARPQWKRPPLNILRRPSAAKQGPEFSAAAMRGNARLLEDVLADFGVKGEVKDIKPGPVVTLYELEPSRGTKSSRVIGLADDIARSMSVASIRAAVVPGRNAIGLELPNMRRDSVMLREILEAPAYAASEATLPLALGKTIGGDPVVADLARMPHLLIAGTTGSGKSVGINAFILSLLYRLAPDECRLLLIDPKMLELSVYNGIPHLLTPVVTDPQRAVAALNWAVGEMEERYKRMATLNVRSVEMFNNRVRNAKKRGEMLSRTVQTGFDKSGQARFETQTMDLEPLPHIVIVVDEFADLMIAAGKDVELAVQRLAQMARAAGIHLVMATQRPSVDVITGTIKANFPTRISFKVTSKVDSRTILNEQGAEQLLGQGDMLYSAGSGSIVRVHGAFVSDEEVEALTESLRRQGAPKFVDGICDVPPAASAAEGPRETSEDDLFDRAVAIVVRDRKASTSYLQRRLGIGYNRAADLIERMERDGLISPANAVGKRDIHAGTADAAGHFDRASVA